MEKKSTPKARGVSSNMGGKTGGLVDLLKPGWVIVHPSHLSPTSLYLMFLLIMYYVVVNKTRASFLFKCLHIFTKSVTLFLKFPVLSVDSQFQFQSVIQIDLS